MDIHAPGRLPASVREFLLHIAIVTTGILIALSLEGALEAWHHHELAMETRERVRAELRGNQESVRTVIGTLGPARMRFFHAMQVASDLAKPENSKEAQTLFGEGPGNVSSNISFAFFNTAAYTTAQVTGALSYMDFDEVLQYANAYDLQQMYARFQDDAEKSIVGASILATRALGKPTPAEQEDIKRQLLLAIGGLYTIDNLAHSLDGLYQKALAPAKE